MFTAGKVFKRIALESLDAGQTLFERGYSTVTLKMLLETMSPVKIVSRPGACADSVVSCR